METHEMIQLSGAPFPKPLPMPASELASFLHLNGYAFEPDGTDLRMYAGYEPGRLGRLRQLLNDNGIELGIRRTLQTVYNEEDFSKSPLWFCIGIPDLFVPNVNMLTDCSICGKKTIHLAPRAHQLGKLDTRKSIVNINGQFTVIRSDLCEIFSRTLSGITLLPFDSQNRYFYLIANAHLRTASLLDDCVIGLREKCPSCGLPRFDVLFGPLRYPAKEWGGHDVAFCDLLDRNVYTPLAFNLLKKYVKTLKREAIILLE